MATGYAIAKLTGADYDVKDALIDAALGAAGAGIVSKLDKINDLRRASRAVDGVGDAAKGVSKLETRIAEHIKKLEDYKANPDAFDNKGFLKNAPTDEIRERIINGRIKHLEDEIKAFRKALDEANE